MSLLRLLGRFFAPSSTDEHAYECVCGAPMKQVAAVEYNEYCVQTWTCTDEECLRGGKVYRFDDDEDSYGEGVLEGKVP
jgi:hypothetical protein